MIKIWNDTYYKFLLSVIFLSNVVFCANAQADNYESTELFDSEVYHGIDVSNHQGRIDWDKVAKDENVQFVYIKATEGATYVSPTFEQNIQEARKAGMKVGCYHFLRATSYIHDQFRNFIEYCREDEQDLAPLIDIEVKGSWLDEEVADSVKLFADLLEEYYGVRPIIYTGTNFYNKYLSEEFNDGYELFIAKYSENEPELIDGTDYTIWQFTDCGEVNGIYTDVDQSRFNKGKSLKDILFTPIQRDPNVIAKVKVITPIISMNMQRASSLKSSRTKRITQHIKKEHNNQSDLRLTDHKKTKKKRHRRSDIDDEDDYKPTSAQTTAKSTRSRS